MKNSLFAIKPYRWEGLWVFDDPAVGLEKEPFVGGADLMLDRITSHIPDAAEGCVAVFSASNFPGAQVELTWSREEMGGNVYRWDEQNMEGWLCPALFKYFPEAPKKLFIQVKPAG